MTYHEDDFCKLSPDLVGFHGCWRSRSRSQSHHPHRDGCAWVLPSSIAKHFRKYESGPESLPGIHPNSVSFGNLVDRAEKGLAGWNKRPWQDTSVSKD